MTIVSQFANCLDNLVSQQLPFRIYYTMLYSIQNANIAILANKSSTARDILGRVQLAYENILKWLQQGVINWNKR